MAKEVVVTREGYNKLEQELENLRTVKRKEVADKIKVARGYGDLSENAEYDAAKAKEAEVYGNINRIEQILRTATFVDDSAASTDVVSLGNVVRVLDMEYDEEDEYTIVGFTEADPMKLFISNESPIGAALIGAHLGETVEANTPGGKIKLKILEIRKR